ncbi:MAG: hypothetical protein PHX83_16505 [Acidobacteriia bacterium]|nr:hypothetical protein [Terriglobia bacterium]
MPHFVLIRPPRRQPRILAAETKKNTLVIVVLDPWEIRYAGCHELPISTTLCAKRLTALLSQAICRERPQAIGVLKGNGILPEQAQNLAHTIKVPIFIPSPAQVRKLAASAALEESLPGLKPIDPRLLKSTTQLAQATLSLTLRDYFYGNPKPYVRRQKDNPRQ